MFLCALVGPLCPPPPAPCLLFVPFLCVRPSCRCFFFVLALLAAPARPACDLCSSSCYPGPAALSPLSRLSLLPFSFSQSTLPARLSSLPVHRCHTCVPLLCPTPAPPSRPYPFPWVLPRSPPLTPSWLPGALCGGGGGLIWSSVYPPLCSSRACLTTLIAYSVPSLSVSLRQCFAVRPFLRPSMG